MLSPPSPLLAAQNRIRHLYQGDVFSQAAARWADALGQQFRRLETADGPVLNWGEPAETCQRAADFLQGPKSTPDDVSGWLPEFSQLVATILQNGQNLHHPRYIGHQVPAAIPIAALFDAIGSATNQVMAIYEMGPWATAVERAMVTQLGAEIGYPAGSFAGFVTSGGSIANLTSLLTARNVLLDNAWQQGIQDARRLAFIVQADSHYCVTRAAGILGIGTDQIVKIAVDENRRMIPDELDRAIHELQRQKRQIIAVAASACATPIGAFDPLEEIATICEKHDIWFHVDAAHGGAALLSDQHRHLVAGIEKADSVVWDAHKMLFMPALCAFVFYKNSAHRFAAFQQNAPYLFDPSDPGIAEYDTGTQTLECTKRAAAYGLWGIWSLFGRQLFTDLVDVTFELAQSMHQMLVAAPDFQPLHQPQCNILAFRYRPPSTHDWPNEKLGDLQLHLRRRLITSGNAYIVPIKLDGYGALRATVINPCTTSADIQQVLDQVRSCGDEIISEWSLS